MTMTKHAVQAARMFDGERLVDGGVRSCSTAAASLPMLIKPDTRPDPDGPPGYDGSAFTRSILAGHDNPAIRPAASPPTQCITTATLMACWSGRVSIWTPAA